jgi:hypothetical protein
MIVRKTTRKVLVNATDFKDHILCQWRRKLVLHCPAYYLFHADFFLGLLFNPDGGGDKFLRNIGWLSTDYMTLYCRKQNSSQYYSLYMFCVKNIFPKINTVLCELRSTHMKKHT